MVWVKDHWAFMLSNRLLILRFKFLILIFYSLHSSCQGAILTNCLHFDELHFNTAILSENCHLHTCTIEVSPICMHTCRLVYNKVLFVLQVLVPFPCPSRWVCSSRCSRASLPFTTPMFPATSRQPLFLPEHKRTVGEHLVEMCTRLSVCVCVLCVVCVCVVCVCVCCVCVCVVCVCCVCVVCVCVVCVLCVCVLCVCCVCVLCVCVVCVCCVCVCCVCVLCVCVLCVCVVCVCVVCVCCVCVVCVCVVCVLCVCVLCVCVP